MIKNESAEGVFINLVRSLINNEKPSALPEGVTADELYEIGHKQKMIPIILCALNMVSPKPKSNNWGKYNTMLVAGSINTETQMSEYHRLVEYLCSNNMKVIPLKGCIIQELYPYAGLRTMSDVDLLYSGVSAKKAADLMEAFGYTAEQLNIGYHDKYRKEGNIGIELHRKLVVDDSPYRPVLDNMFDKAMEDDTISNLYYMKHEDFYIHVIVHAAKHLMEGNLGVRPICDIFLLNEKYKNDWNRQYITEQLSSVALDRFENKLYELAYAFFGSDDKDVSEEDLQFLFQRGSYGISRKEKEWELNTLKYKTKFGVLFYKIFWPYSKMIIRYPILKNHPYLLPVYWVWRWIELIKHDARGVGKVLTADISNEKASETQRIFTNFGLGE